MHCFLGFETSGRWASPQVGLPHLRQMASETVAWLVMVLKETPWGSSWGLWCLADRHVTLYLSGGYLPTTGQESTD